MLIKNICVIRKRARQIDNSSYLDSCVFEVEVREVGSIHGVEEGVSGGVIGPCISTSVNGLPVILRLAGWLDP